METNETITPQSATAPAAPEDQEKLERLIAEAEQRGYERALAERATAVCQPEPTPDAGDEDDDEDNCGFLANLRPDFWEN